MIPPSNTMFKLLVIFFVIKIIEDTSFEYEQGWKVIL